MKTKNSVRIFLVFIFVFLANLQPVSAQADAPLTITGWFSVIWGDGPEGLPEPEAIYTLTDGAGETTILLMSDEVAVSQGGILALNHQRVTVQGSDALPLPSLDRQESTPTTMQVVSIALEKQPEGINANRADVLGISGSRPFVSIMCKFQDNASEPKTQSYFLNMYGGSYPGLDHYWREVSYNNVNVAGSNAYGWYVLPRPRSSYDSAGSFNLDLAATDCTNAADANINFANYPGGINLMFNGELDGYAWGGSKYMTLDGVSNVWPMTWEPPWGYADIAVIAHEMGHAFGLPHSSGSYGQTYDNQWDVMSDTWSNCYRSRNATYGCLGQHTNSAYKDLLNWIPLDQKFVAGTNTNAIITLEQLALPATNNYKMVKIPINGSSTHYYTVEVRRQVGYDVKLPGQAVIIHEVDLSRSRPAYVVDSDGNGNTGDAGAMWTVGEVFRDPTNLISVSVIYSVSTGYQVHITTGQNAYYISGNIGLPGETVSYTGGSTTSDSNGYYSIAVPSGWTGTVTPVKSGYTFAPVNRSYTNVLANQTDQNYIVASIGPGVLSIMRANANPTNAASVNFTVTFSKSVSGVGLGDFGLTTTGGVSGAAVSGVSPSSGSIYTVSVNTGSGNGAIRLNVVDDNSIVDSSSNALGGTVIGDGSFTAGEFYKIKKISIGGNTAGVFRPSNGLLYLKNLNSTGFADVAINYGTAGDYPVAGDWDGNGTATIGIYRNGSFYLRNSNTLGFADLVFAFGQAGDQPIAGDWDGNGIDTIGIFRPSTGQFLLRNSNTSGAADMSFYLGNVGDVGIAGDWNGDGIDTTGVFRPSNGIIFMKNTNVTGFADIAINYGLAGDQPVTGDWNNDGIDTIGVYRNTQFLLRNSNTLGFADIVFGLGNPGDMPISGNWDGAP